MDTPKTWYVYLLCDPDTEEPFYVGKGTGGRIHQHEQMLNSRIDCNEEKKRIIREIHARGKQVLKKKIAEFNNEQDAYIYEKATIQAYRSRLTNIRLGGSRFSQPKPVRDDVKRVPIVYTEDDPYMPIQQVAIDMGWSTPRLYQTLERMGIKKHRFAFDHNRWLAIADVKRIKEIKEKPWIAGEKPEEEAA